MAVADWKSLPFRISRWGTVGACLLLAILLLRSSFTGDHIVEIQVQVLAATDVEIETEHFVEPVADSGVARVALLASTQSWNPQSLSLWVRSRKEDDFHEQKTRDVMGPGRLMWTVQLGSGRWPLRNEELYYFKVKSSEGRPDENVLYGIIEAKPYRRVGADVFFATALSLVAAILQIMTFVWPPRASPPAPASCGSSG